MMSLSVASVLSREHLARSSLALLQERMSECNLGCFPPKINVGQDRRLDLCVLDKHPYNCFYGLWSLQEEIITITAVIVKNAI